LARCLLPVTLVLTVARWKKPDRNARLWASWRLPGLIDVFIMSMVYQLPAVPVWNTVSTTLAFWDHVPDRHPGRRGAVQHPEQGRGKGDPLDAVQRTRLVGVFFVAAVLGLT
jgi:hypothetical protein